MNKVTLKVLCESAAPMLQDAVKENPKDQAAILLAVDRKERYCAVSLNGLPTMLGTLLVEMMLQNEEMIPIVELALELTKNTNT